MEPLTTLRIRERDALLTRLRSALESDPRVLAIWLHGSLGRGTGDAWSDLDLWIVVADEAYTPEIRHEFASGALFTEEAPQNGPPGGTYLMSAHDAPTGAHLVDWYFQPLRFASKASGRLVLLDRAAWPPQVEEAPPHTEWNPTESEDVANKAALFWAMVLVQAKYVARRPVEDGMGFEGFLLSLLGDVANARAITLAEVVSRDLRLADEKLLRLRGLSDRLTEVAPDLSAPHEPVARFLATIGAETEGAA